MTARPRGTEALGFYKEEAQHIPIARVTLAADLPEGQRPTYEVMRSDSDAFGAYITGRANRGGDFLDVPAGGVDLCSAPVPTRTKGPCREGGLPYPVLADPSFGYALAFPVPVLGAELRGAC